MENTEKVTQDGQTSQTVEQPDKSVETLEVQDRDPKTGQRRDKAIQVTKDEKDALAKQGYRFAQEMGFLKNKSKEDAEKMAAEMTQTQMQQFIAALKEKQPSIKPPTVEELQDKPGLMLEYVDKVRQMDREEILATTRKEREDEKKQKAEDDQMLLAYDTEIKAVLPDFPALPRDILVDAIQVRHTDLADVRDLAEELQEKILNGIDPTKLPEDKRKAYAEKLTAEKPPTTGPEGSATETKKPLAKSADEVYREEAKLHGWKL